MPYIANLLIVTDNDQSELCPALSKAGYLCRYISFSKMLDGKIGEEAFDLLIVDSEHNTANVNIEHIASFADLNGFSILVIGETDVQCHASTLSPGYCDLELLSRVSSLVRLENMQQELHRRILSTETYGIDLSDLEKPYDDISDTHILIIGNKSLILGNILLRLDCRAKIQILKDPETAIEELRKQEFDAVILSGTGHGDRNLRLANEIRSDSRFYNLPMIMVLENAENREAAYIHGVSDIVLHETEMDTLINRATVQILQYRYRSAMQKLFRVTKPHPLADGPTDMYSFGFMKTHLPKMMAEHDQRKKTMSVASLKITNLEAVNSSYGFSSGDQLLRQVGSAIFYLVRGEDFCGRYENGHFVVALPGTREKEANIALRRLVGVIRNTEFALKGASVPIKVELEFGLAEAEPNEALEEILTRGFLYEQKDEQAA
ncbi:diguanylate cyclase [Sneathiella marina]|uniref:diguanylate cyclase n=1 Tax=Sneathiella marina TaxID=2950108 RepID=A0ABY4W100_9PROT|nr:diguanylate cyclase [Sneathiella marina]USG59522.1 diguanylate cyclase [Sneathiella marina]